MNDHPYQEHFADTDPNSSEGYTEPQGSAYITSHSSDTSRIQPMALYTTQAIGTAYAPNNAILPSRTGGGFTSNYGYNGAPGVPNSTEHGYIVPNPVASHSVNTADAISQSLSRFRGNRSMSMEDAQQIASTATNLYFGARSVVPSSLPLSHEDCISTSTIKMQNAMSTIRENVLAAKSKLDASLTSCSNAQHQESIRQALKSIENFSDELYGNSVFFRIGARPESSTRYDFISSSLDILKNSLVTILNTDRECGDWICTGAIAKQKTRFEGLQTELEGIRGGLEVDLARVTPISLPGRPA